MKSLIAIATLGLTLSFSSLSFASNYMDLYTRPVVKNEVKDEIRSGNVEKDFMSLYTGPKSVNTVTLVTADQKLDDKYISVFGVQIPRIPGA